MCGIYGIVHGAETSVDPSVLDAAARVQAHRGPDSSGYEKIVLGERTLVLGHQRLAIIDLTDAGHQPMSYRDGEGCLVYNGELYNYLELRTELRSAGERFSTRTDTEVLLAALHSWGVRAALERFNWMGAFAWLDRRREQLVIARDSGSEKPLYYYCSGSTLVFASEIKTLLILCRRRFALERDVVGQFLFQGLISASKQTFFEGVFQLDPGTYAELPIAGSQLSIEPVRYRSPPYPGDPRKLSFDEFSAEVNRIFVDSVRVRLRSDVPVGVLLSGGIDSSAIASVTQVLNGAELAPHLLSAISNDSRFDESGYIAIMEKHLGRRAEKVQLSADVTTLVDSLAEINWINDVPVTGLSALGHFEMMKRARELGLTVLLSGQGADEIFLGYRKFLGFYLQSLVRTGHWLRAVTTFLGFVKNRSIVTQFNAGDAKRYLPALARLERITKRHQSETVIAGGWLQRWLPEPLGLGSGTLADRQLLDIRKYSVPALCHYEDRMSMAASREIRLPYLDSRLVDLLIRSPDDYKLRDGWSKYVFRKAMERQLPAEICWRKDKKGFSNPQGEWLKRELRDSVLEMFSSNSLMARKGVINSPALLAKYRRYCDQPVEGGLIWYREIFAPFSLEIWMRQYEVWID